MIFGTLIKVISGFYLGCTGVVTDVRGAVIVHNGALKETFEYSVALKCASPRGTVLLDRWLGQEEIKEIR